LQVAVMALAAEADTGVALERKPYRPDKRDLA